MNNNLFEVTLDKKKLRKDIDMFFYAAMSAICHCYSHKDGFYPDDCDCEDTERVQQSMSLLIEERKRILRENYLD